MDNKNLPIIIIPLFKTTKYPVSILQSTNPKNSEIQFAIELHNENKLFNTARLIFI